MLVRGKADLDALESEVHISLAKFEYDAAVEPEQAMKAYDKADRFGSVLEVTYSRTEDFVGEVWGRRRRS